MEEIISDIGSTPSLEPVTDDNILELFNSASSATTLQPTDDQQQQQQQSQDIAHDPSTEVAEREKRPAKIHSCGFCGAVYTSYRELAEHRASHGGSRPYECHICDKRFTQKAHLIIHRRTHTGEKPYSCHICHKRFSQTSHLNSHKRVHTGEKPYFCSLCNMGFCRRQRLEVHLQQHAKDMQQGYTAQNPTAQELLQQGMSVQKTLQQQSPALASETAKDFLLSMGLSNVMQEAGRSGLAGDGVDSSSASKGISAQSQMSVFPGFSMEEGGRAENEELDENDHADGGEDRESRSPTPTSCSQSQRSPTPTSAKSRRKPAFVRKLGFGQAEKEENKAEEAASANKAAAEENGADDSKADLSDHAAAVRAMIHMATGADYPNTEDLMNDLSALNNTNPASSSFPTSSASSQHPHPHHPHHRNSLSLGKPFPGNRHLPPSPAMLSSLIRTNTRVSLVDFTAEDLLRHLMSRDDVYRCDFCCVIFHDAAMYHLHRSMHDKMDIRCCNLCGLLLTDKYDFTAHFLSQHK